MSKREMYAAIDHLVASIVPRETPKMCMECGWTRFTQEYPKLPREMFAPIEYGEVLDPGCPKCAERAA